VDMVNWIYSYSGAKGLLGNTTWPCDYYGYWRWL